MATQTEAVVTQAATFPSPKRSKGPKQPIKTADPGSPEYLLPAQVPPAAQPLLHAAMAGRLTIFNRFKGVHSPAILRGVGTSAAFPPPPKADLAPALPKTPKRPGALDPVRMPPSDEKAATAAGLLSKLDASETAFHAMAPSPRAAGASAAVPPARSPPPLHQPPATALRAGTPTKPLKTAPTKPHHHRKPRNRRASAPVVSTIQDVEQRKAKTKATKDDSAAHKRAPRWKRASPASPRRTSPPPNKDPAAAQHHIWAAKKASDPPRAPQTHHPFAAATPSAPKAKPGDGAVPPKGAVESKCEGGGGKASAVKVSGEGDSAGNGKVEKPSSPSATGGVKKGGNEGGVKKPPPGAVGGGKKQHTPGAQTGRMKTTD